MFPWRYEVSSIISTLPMGRQLLIMQKKYRQKNNGLCPTTYKFTLDLDYEQVRWYSPI
jgi:hypothetical protein